MWWQEGRNQDQCMCVFTSKVGVCCGLVVPASRKHDHICWRHLKKSRPRLDLAVDCHVYFERWCRLWQFTFSCCLAPEGPCNPPPPPPLPFLSLPFFIFFNCFFIFLAFFLSEYMPGDSMHPLWEEEKERQVVWAKLWSAGSERWVLLFTVYIRQVHSCSWMTTIKNYSQTHAGRQMLDQNCMHVLHITP